MKISVGELHAQSAALLADIDKGEVCVLTRDNEAVAVAIPLVPCSPLPAGEEAAERQVRADTADGFPTLRVALSQRRGDLLAEQLPVAEVIPLPRKGKGWKRTIRRVSLPAGITTARYLDAERHAR
jgi:antitoxin (DNA-binding transcriptional repressor) of toxin-antitoxin stability system